MEKVNKENSFLYTFLKASTEGACLSKVGRAFQISGPE